MHEIKVPDIIGGANVVCYAVVNLCIPTGNPEDWIRGQLYYGLAICKYENAAGYYLFYCNDQWIESADGCHETIEDAKDQAESEYAGIENNWVNK